MRTAVEVQAVEPVAPGHDWSLWMRQIRAILRIEVKKNFGAGAHSDLPARGDPGVLDLLLMFVTPMAAPTSARTGRAPRRLSRWSYTEA